MRYLLLVLLAIVGMSVVGCVYAPYREEPREETIERSKKIEKTEWEPTLGN
ncbi:MAG: hypothetical protein N2234_07640 [Planctomycetota bacterium]|nr:hypothetical protein [Planctomycetota bacterium]